MAPVDVDVTELLRAYAEGDPVALETLFPVIYDELRRVARARLRHERAGHTLAATELVHEAFFRLVRLDRIDWRSRAHFLAVASRAMRQVLLDHAERRDAGKRGGGLRAVTLERLPLAHEDDAGDAAALCEALARLEELQPRQARVVECRFFGGLSLEETAEALGVSEATVSRDWTVARAWLHAQLSDDPGAVAHSI
jgi:RNA polymerase sigma factor (TIGR02999 family)